MMRGKSIFESSNLWSLIVLSCVHIFNYNDITDALPITSKPIENTAESLAWQAWLMLPSEQKNLEKSRKVTPKSIFTLPLRDCPSGYKKIEMPCGNDCYPGQMVKIGCVTVCPKGYKENNFRCVLDCPPGHKVFEFNCISLFSIDQEQLLVQELGLLTGNSENAYDYEDDEMLLYDTPEKLNGDLNLNVPESYASDSQLPSQDEPLKFNIFEEKLPNDYMENVADSSPVKGTAQAIYDELIGFLTNSEGRHNETKNKDLISAPADPIKNNENNSSLESNKSTIHPDLFPPSLMTFPHKISLFKDENKVTVVSDTLISPKHEKDSELSSNLPELLIMDRLLPVNNKTLETAFLMETSDGQLSNLESKKQLESIPSTSPKLPLETEDSFTLLPSIEVNRTELVSDINKLASTKSDEVKSIKKSEHMRSVPTVAPYSTSGEISKTAKDETTTNLNLDETTLIGNYELPLQALQTAQTNHPHFKENNYNMNQGETHMVLKKAQVEPTEQFIELRMEITTESNSSPISDATEISIKPLENVSIIKLGTSSLSDIKLLNTAALNSSGSMQVTNPPDSKYAKENSENQENPEANTVRISLLNNKDSFRIATRKSPTDFSSPSESESDVVPTSTKPVPLGLDIEKELRLINTLVKENQNSKNSIDGISGTTSERSSTTDKTSDSTFSVLNLKEDDLETEASTSIQSTLPVIRITLPDSSPQQVFTTEPANTVVVNKYVKYSESTTETPSTVSIFKKFLPILGFKTISTSTYKPNLEDNPSTISEIPEIAANKTENILNRSNRNSKIARTDLFYTTEESRQGMKRNKYGSLKVTPDIESTTVFPEVTTPTIEKEELFWWLPAGWRLDRKASVEAQNTTADQQTLLFHLWSTPESKSNSSSSSSSSKGPSQTTESSATPTRTTTTSNTS